MPRILIIEDSGDIQQLLSFAFFKEGYETHYAFNGREGYDKVLSAHPDIVLLDMMLPVLNGLEVMRMLASDARTRNIPVILMTAHGNKSGLLEDFKAHGVREYILKPFDLKEIVSMVGRILARAPKPASGAGTRISKGVVALDIPFRRVSIDAKVVATLSPTKAALLKLLIEASGEVKREAILRAVWGKGARVSALEKAVQRLRDDLGPESRRIQTTPRGYRLIGETAAS